MNPKISKYTDFMLQRLFESILVTSDEFYDILYHMTGDVAEILRNLIGNRRDIKTNYNYVHLSDKNDEVAFIPDSQYQRFKKEISGAELEAKTKSKSKIGRMVKQLLSENNYTDISDRQIEEFVNKFKANWDRKHGISKKEIKIVKGKDILYWYDSNNYAVIKGTLGNSCMSSARKNDFMKIYAENSDKISMVILTENDQLIARAILWKIDPIEYRDYKFYLDRIYTVNDSDVNVIYDWTLENVVNKDKNLLCAHMNQDYNRMALKVSLNKINFDHYPYADTFSCLYIKMDISPTEKISIPGFLSNRSMKKYWDEYAVFGMQDTDGSKSPISHNYSTYSQKYIPLENSIWVSSIDSYMSKDDLNYSILFNTYYLKDETVYSETLRDWIPKSKAISHPKFGLVVKESIVTIVSEYKGDARNPVDFYKDFHNNFHEKFVTEEALRNDEGHQDLFVQGHFCPHDNRYRRINWKNSFKMMDYRNDVRIKNDCLKLVRVDTNAKESDEVSQYVFNRISTKYMVEEDAIIFKIFYNKEENTDLYVSYDEYRNRFLKMIYDRYVKATNDCPDISDDQKIQRLVMLEDIDKYSLSESDTYRNRNVFYKKSKLPAIEVFNLLFERIYKKLISSYKLEEIILSKYKSQFESRYSPDDNRSLLSVFRIYLYNYILYKSTSYARDVSKVILEDSPGFEELYKVMRSKYNLDFVCNRFVVYYTLESEIEDLIERYFGQYSSEIGIGNESRNSGYDFRRILSSVIIDDKNLKYDIEFFKL